MCALQAVVDTALGSSESFRRRIIEHLGVQEYVRINVDLITERLSRRVLRDTFSVLAPKPIVICKPYVRHPSLACEGRTHPLLLAACCVLPTTYYLLLAT